MPVSISPESHWKLKTTAIVALIVSVFGVGVSFAGKADKSEVKEVSASIYELREKRAEDARDLKYIVQFLEKVDQGVKEIRTNQQDLNKMQIDTLREILKQREPMGLQLPPAPINR